MKAERLGYFKMQTRKYNFWLQILSVAGQPVRTTFCPSCSALIPAAAASLTTEGQHSVMSRITKGGWQE